MKNFKRIALGLLVGAMAIGFSSFTNAQKGVSVKLVKIVKSGFITDNFIVQPIADNFVEQSTTPSTDDCAESSDRFCVYDVTTLGKSNIPDQTSYSKSDIDSYVMNSWLTPASGATDALYEP